MRLEHSFDVPVPVDEAWQVLLDIPRVAPCLPGATLTGVDGDDFTGTVKVKLGPITLTYQGKGRFVERDEAARRVVLEASGRDVRAAGTASATVTSTLVGKGEATTVEVTTDLTVTGRPAQFGRGMISEVSAKLIGQFADCLAGTLSAPNPAPATAGTEATAEAAAGTEAAGASGAAGSAGTPAMGTAQVASTTESTSVAAEAEPVDLLRLTGSTAAARRLAAYGIGALVFAVLAALGIRRWRRSRAGL